MSPGAGVSVLPGDGPWSHAGTRAGVVCLHNFTAGPHVLRTVVEPLVDAGHSVEAPLLSGHGGTPEDIVPFGFDDFLHDARQALERVRSRSDTTVLFGAGAGGTCALRLAAERDDVAGVAVVAAPTGPFDARLVRRARELLEAGDELTPAARAGDAAPSPSRPVPAGTGVAGPVLPARMPIRPYLRLHEAATTLDLAGIACPVLAFYDAGDATLVDARAHADGLVRGTSGAVEMVRLEGSGHFATTGPAAVMIGARVLAFVESLHAG